MTEHFDYLIIGAGSGGIASANRAASYGARVAIVEASHVGGTCVNLGCVPKKVMWLAAQMSEHLSHAEDFGFSGVSPQFSWKTLTERRETYLQRLRGLYHKTLDNNKISFFPAKAEFLDANTVLAGTQKLSADHILVATGGRPTLPDIPGALHGITSDDFFALKEQPKEVCIVGAGYIAVELAGVMAALGSDVTLAIRRDSILRTFDPMLSDRLISHMRASGITIETGFTPASLQKESNGSKTLLSNDSRSLKAFDEVIWAIGRTPNTDNLGLEKAGLSVDDRGFLPSDKFESCSKSIYALGDVTGKSSLTPVAIAAGRKLSDRLFGGQTDAHYPYGLVPTVIFSHPPIATVGMSLPEAQAAHGSDNLSVFDSTFTPMDEALSEKPVRTAMRLVCLKSSLKVLGCHLFGHHADEILQGFAVAIQMGATKKDFDATLAIHPTSAEELVTLK